MRLEFALIETLIDIFPSVLLLSLGTSELVPTDLRPTSNPRNPQALSKDFLSGHWGICPPGYLIGLSLLALQ